MRPFALTAVMALMAAPTLAQGLPPLGWPAPRSVAPDPWAFAPSAPAPRPVTPPAWTGQQVGTFTYWNAPGRPTVTCQQIGAFTHCN